MAIDSILSLSLVRFEEAGQIFFAFFNDHTLGVVVAVAIGVFRQVKTNHLGMRTFFWTKFGSL